MKNIFLATALALVLAQSADAGVLELTAGTTQIENVNVAAGAQATVEGRKSQLTLAGAGLRTKKVAIVTAKVYVAELFVADVSKYVRTLEGALDSLSASNTVAIQLTLLRSLDADTVATSFKEALNANNVNTAGSSVQAFLALAQNDAPTGKTVTIIGEKLADGSEILTVEKPNGDVASIKGQKGFIRDIFSIWLGVPADKGLESLKKSLVGAGS